MGLSSMTVRARSVARQGAGTTCLYVLDPTASSATDVQSAALSYITCLDTTALTVTVGPTDMNPGSTVQVTVAYKLQPFLVPVSANKLTLHSTSTQLIVQ